MIWYDAKNCVPDKFGNAGFIQVLCRVRTPNGFCDFAVLRFDEDGNWWMYVPKLGPAFNGGWCGLERGMEVLEWAYIED